METIDGVSVSYKDFSENEFEASVGSPASAVYDQHGAFIFYDRAVIDQISDMAKYLILEHERAHHRLGHTLFTKIRRELKLGMPAFYESQKEKDADCEAGYRLREEWGGVTRSEITNAMAEIYYALGAEEGDSLPNWLLSRIDRLDVCKDGKLLKRPEVVMRATDVKAAKIEGLSSKPVKRHHGPNCWNSALYMSDLAHQVRFVSSEEFNHLMESPYCKTLDAPEVNAIKVYRTQISGVQGAAREVHAALWLDEVNSFNKMTALSTSAYQVEAHSTVDATYAQTSSVARYPVLLSSGKWSSVQCESESCENEILYKKCQTLRDIESDIHREDYQKIYNELLMLESKIASFLFDAKLVAPKILNDLIERLSIVEREIAGVSSLNDQEAWQLRYFQTISNSLLTQLTMRQPNWLASNK